MSVETFAPGFICSALTIGCVVALWFLLRYVGVELATELVKVGAM